MKQRTKYQRPLNWRKRKFVLERESVRLHRMEPFKEDIIAKRLIGEDRYKKTLFELQAKLKEDKVKLQTSMDKLAGQLRIRFYEVFISHKKKFFISEPIKEFKISYCSCQKHFGLNVETRPRNTAFEDDSKNLIESCMHCFIEDWDYYQELWDNHYSNNG